MENFQSIYSSPLGLLHIVCSNEGLLSLKFIDGDGHGIQPNENEIVQKCQQQLDEYFGGTRKDFDIPLTQEGTPFQQKVWQLLAHIPFGKTLSYQTLSKQYGDPKAIRAIAAANGKNKIAIIIPCHRVIGTDQSLTGYAGGLWRKQWLLQHEAKWALGVQQLF